ncbi:MAG: SDR family oxidoreductase [Acidimicrobiales bacterium]|nr:SDR family oxidoreductase [Acidimicrobiales bacterium]
MDLGIKGRKAAVAASSSGLGFAAAKALAAEGVSVAINGRDPDRLAAAVEQIGPGATPIRRDVSTPTGASAFVEAAIEALGGLDILVTNAGGPPPGTFASTDLDAYPAALEQNLLSVVAMCKAAVPGMQAQRWGRVVAITSVTVRQPISDLILSTTARAGATGFLKTLALEVAADGVTVNSLQPGYHATDRLLALNTDLDAVAKAVPARVIGQPEDFGSIVAFLCSEPARYLTGAAIPVDGGAYRGLL